MKTIYVKPALDTNPERKGKHLIVRDPDRAYAPLPEEGSFVNPTGYWMTMLRDGSVVKADPPATTPPQGASAAATNNRPRRSSAQH